MDISFGTRLGRECYGDAAVRDSACCVMANLLYFLLPLKHPARLKVVEDGLILGRSDFQTRYVCALFSETSCPACPPLPVGESC
jgi:hypothetical protein